MTAIDMAPRQWGYLRDMIRRVRTAANNSGDLMLMIRAQHLLASTEGCDV